MQIRSFFTRRQMTELTRLYTLRTEFLESSPYTPIGGGFDFDMYQDAAMYAYLVGDQARAASFLRTAVELGFPPDVGIDRTDEYGRQWNNYQNGVSALPMGLAAHLGGMTKQRDAILAWTVSRLIDTELLTEDERRSTPDVCLHRAYALLAAGRFWPKLEAELSLADRLAREMTDWPHRWGLPKMLTVLVQCQKGIFSRRAATTALQQYIRDAKRCEYDRMHACFHALYLQSAFPDVFDPILPPFPAPTDPLPTGNTEGQAE